MRENKGQSLIALPYDFTVIDTETTGMDYELCNIIEISALKVRNGIVIERFSSLVQPPPTIDLDGSISFVDSFITDLTGITNEMLLSAPVAKDVLPQFLTFIGQDILIGHNVSFDINFLYDACLGHNLPFSNNFIDTLRISRKLCPELEHHRLSDIAKAFKIPQPQSHRALADCETALRCYHALREKALEQYTESEFISLFKKRHHRIDLSNIHCQSEEIDEANPIYGKSVVFTGTLSAMTRKEAMQVVVNLGGIIADSVTQKTNFLVIGSEEFASSVKNGKTNKMKKAESLMLKGCDISVISEATFWDMLISSQ